MSFWDNYVNLCNANGKTPNGAAKEIGISSGSITAWKEGRIPRPQNQKQIADYFGVTVDYLLTGEQKEKAPDEIESLKKQATPLQLELIDAVMNMNESQLLLLRKLIDAVK